MRILALLTLLTANAALAHEGHGIEAAHWHPSDTWMLLAGLAGAGALMWWRSRK
ncbi:MAG TPA: hypothetical protein VIW70_09370 [Rubrivivax sp.]